MAMDGQFYNIFPYKKGEYILGTPKYSKFKKFYSLSKAEKIINNIKKKRGYKRKLLSEKIIKRRLLILTNFSNLKGFFLHCEQPSLIQSLTIDQL